MSLSQTMLSESDAEIKHFKDLATAATEVSSYAKRAEGHLFLYLMFRRDVDKDKYPKRLESLGQYINILNTTLKDNEGREILDSIVDHFDKLKPAGNLLMTTHQQGLTHQDASVTKQYELTVTQLHDHTSAIRGLGVELANQVITLENIYRTTLQKNLKTLRITLLTVTGFLLFFVLGSGATLLQISRKLNKEVATRKRSEHELKNERNKLKEAITEMKTMSSLLPICASCKKIRDDKGYWNQIESYFNHHTGAQFSHSICPDCVGKLYPDYKDDIINPPQPE